MSVLKRLKSMLTGEKEEETEEKKSESSDKNLLKLNLLKLQAKLRKKLLNRKR